MNSETTPVQPATLDMEFLVDVLEYHSSRIIRMRKRIDSHTMAAKRHLDIIQKSLVEDSVTGSARSIADTVKTAAFLCAKAPLLKRSSVGRAAEEIELVAKRLQDAKKTDA